MALTLTLDYTHKVVLEPGYHTKVGGEEISETQDPTDQDHSLWCDPLLNTVMLKPLQLDPSWLNTTQQMDSIMRLSDLVVDTADISNRRVREEPRGNSADPWINVLARTYPNTYFPAMVSPFPGSGADPPLTGIPAPDLPQIDLTAIHSHDVYEPPPTDPVVPPKGSEPTPVVAGGWTSGKNVARTKEPLPANAAMFFRYFQPGGAEPVPNETTWVVYIGQFALQFRGVTIQVYEDTSPHGDRSVGVKRLTYPLWGTADESEQERARTFNKVSELGVISRDRWLLWLPYRKNKVLLMADTGRGVILWTRPDNRKLRNSTDTDWVNVRSDTLVVRLMTPTFVRFQIQRVKFAAGPVTVRGPLMVIPYEPAIPPNLFIGFDRDNETNLTGTVESPPTAIPARAEDDCVTGADPPSYQAKKYRAIFTLTPSADRRWTPFLYGYAFDSPPVLSDSIPGEVEVPDTGSTGARLLSARFSTGLKPGEGRGQIEILDSTPFDLEAHYYRSSIPVQLDDDGTILFTGWTEPVELTPLHESTGHPRRVTMPLLDGWKLLSKSFIKNKHDFTGVGHITAVLRLAKEAGIDVDTAETPPINTPTLDRQWNTPLGGESLLFDNGGDPTGNDDDGVVRPWATRSRDTYAGFIQRIARLFSGWDVGFYSDGRLFYLPRDYNTESDLTFYTSAAARTAAMDEDAPLLRDPVTFTTEEPEANVIIVQSGKAKDGGATFSAPLVDWASIRNPDVVNFLGQWRAEVIVVAGGWSCPMLNWTARKIWDQTRRRFITARWEGDFNSAIKVGSVVTLGPYGLYRLTSIKTELDRVGWQPAVYTGVFVDRGYGLPE